MPWTPAERSLEQTLRRVDAAAEGELEAAADPEVQKICNEARVLAARITAQRTLARGGGGLPARRAALDWLRKNEKRTRSVLDRLERAKKDAETLVACVQELQAAAGSVLKPVGDIRRRARSLGASAREHEEELEDDLIAPWELVTWQITVPPSGRGVTKADRLRAQALATRLGATEPIDVGHVTPHVFTRPGDVVRVRPQRRRVNRAEGRDIARAAAARRAAPGLGLPVRPR